MFLMRILFLACTYIAVVTLLAGSGNQGFANGVGTQASFNFPYGVAVDANGTVFVADVVNQRIRKISPTGGTWVFQCSALGRLAGEIVFIFAPLASRRDVLHGFS
jgi:hypothetical protein